MADFFFAFAVDAAPATTHLGAGASVRPQQWINHVVRNPILSTTCLAAVVALLAWPERPSA